MALLAKLYYLSFFLFALFPLQILGYEIAVTTQNGEQASPGKRLFFDIKFTQNEPSMVDVILFDGTRDKEHLIFQENDLQRSANVGFGIPQDAQPGTQYVLRLRASSDKRLLQDSSNFQIFPLLSNTTSVTSATSSNTQTPPTNSSIDTGTQPPHKSTNLGLIIGAALGGLGAILLLLIIVVLIRQRSGKKSGASYELDGTPAPSKLEKGIVPRARNGIQPYTLPPPLEQNPSSAGSGETPPDSAGTGLTGSSTMSKKMRMLRERVGPSGTEATSSTSSPISSNPDGNPLTRGLRTRSPNTPATDIERLRQEREKLNQQIAFLEGRAYVSRSNSAAGPESRSRTHSPTSSSVSASSSARGRVETQLAQQVEVLKEQVRALEGARIAGIEPGARTPASGKTKKKGGKGSKLAPIVTQDLRNQRAPTPVPSEPPPGYAEAPGSPTPISTSVSATKPQQIQSPQRLIPNR